MWKKDNFLRALWDVTKKMKEELQLFEPECWEPNDDQFDYCKNRLHSAGIHSIDEQINEMHHQVSEVRKRLHHYRTTGVVADANVGLDINGCLSILASRWKLIYALRQMSPTLNAHLKGTEPPCEGLLRLQMEFYVSSSAKPEDHHQMAIRGLWAKHEMENSRKLLGLLEQEMDIWMNTQAAKQ
jgi:hypothetical protein